jgi:CHAT domain-containing protein
VAAREATTQYVAFVLISGEAEAAVVPLGAAERIEALIRQWNDAVATAPPVVPAAARAAERGYREAGERLRRAIWDPVAKRLRGSVRIFVVPDAALHLVSLATLPTDDGAYLIETGPMLHYLSTERDLEVATEERAFGRGLLVLGSPDFDHRPIPPPAGGTTLVASAGTPAAPRSAAAPSSYYRGTTTSCDAFRARRWDPLPGTRAEAEEIVSLWSKETSAGASGTAAVMNLTGTAASEAAFKRLAPGRRIVHVSTHGYFIQDDCPSALGERPGAAVSGPTAGEQLPSRVGDNPLLLSGLILAGANRRDAQLEDGEDEDGILTAEEIASLDLTGLEWAVLSACETGLGRLQAGEGILGLRRAFEIAGAGTLIMTLWRVKDEPSRAWMRELYTERLQGLSTAEAVRGASIAILSSRREDGLDTHPFSWGAFVATGDWR